MKLRSLRSGLIAVVAMGLAGACGNDSATGFPPDGTTAGDGSSPLADATAPDSPERDAPGGDDGPLFSGDDGGGTLADTCAGAAASRSSVGCEYYALNPDASDALPGLPLATGSRAGGCFAAFLANTGTSPATVHVDYAGQTLDPSKSLYLPQGSGAGLSYVPLTGGTVPPNQVAILFLAHFHFQGDDAGGGGLLLGADSGPGGANGPSQEQLCPGGVTVAYGSADAAVHGTGRGHAFHITTSSPVVAYDIYPYGGASSYVTSATLLLPTSVWDTNYVAASGYQGETALNADSDIALVASQDHTTVTIRPAADITAGGGIAAAAQGVPTTYLLDQGEAIQFEQLADLSGSIVASDKPIGAWGGHYCMVIPYTPPNFLAACDAAHQQIPPVKALGSEYVAVRYRSRTSADESVPWRMVGAVDGTTLAYEPAAPAGAPSSLARGQVVEFESPGPFVVTSQDAQHPFYFAGHMTAGDLAGGLGDPETVNVVPPAQFLDHYVLFTDPTYSETNLVVVRGATNPSDVTLDCLTGPLTGWQAIGSRYQYTRVDVQKGGAPVGACDNGRHEMKSSAPFGVTVWGFDRYVSYAYPAGASVRPVNTVVVPPVLQ